MEEIKVIIEALGGVGETGVWLVVAFLFYKLSTLASILYVVKIAIDRIQKWALTKKTTVNVVERPIMLDNHIITHTDERNAERFVAALKKLKPEESLYLHNKQIEMFEEAVDYVLKKRKK